MKEKPLFEVGEIVQDGSSMFRTYWVIEKASGDWRTLRRLFWDTDPVKNPGVMYRSDRATVRAKVKRAFLSNHAKRLYLSPIDPKKDKIIIKETPKNHKNEN